MLVFDPVTEEVSGGLSAPAFQNVHLTSSFVAETCRPDDPRGGLLLQSEPGGGSWRINEMLLHLDGTALLQASPNDVLLVYVYEGQVGLEVNGLSRIAQAGELLRVLLQNGSVVAMPGPALAVTPPDALTAPLSLLPRAVPSPAAVEPLPEQEGQVVCDVIPQQQIDGTFVILADEAQTMRVSAGGPNTIGVVGYGPDGQMLSLTGELSTTDNASAYVVDFMAETAGAYTFIVTPDDSLVRWGVTCDLPQAPPLPKVQACSDVLLQWPAVTGNAVRFTAPFGAAVSVQAVHPLPSQGAAETLTVQMSSGEEVGQMPFTSFVAQQVAGPFEFIAPRETEYHVLWDGDPFNSVDVEVLCLPPTSETGKSD